ncbi:Desiccation-like protein [Citrus sinensis]|uniref:Desiccation-like protein n=1 Tax=Citrus sinensis TaxID=2711 RepID=A0ACB8KLG0_CITSI|nr:Desiccation-like protein [Citrus sinensis]
MATSKLEVLLTISFLICISYCLADQFKYPRACWPTSPLPEPPLCRDDVDNLQFAQSLEHLEAELFLGGGLGYGLDKVAPYLSLWDSKAIDGSECKILFAKLIDEAFGFPLDPPFYPYRDSLSYMLAAGLLSPESGQDRIVREYLFGRADQIVKPYNYTVARECAGLKMKGFLSLRSLELNRRLVAMSRPWAFNSFSYPRSPEEILRISYGTGNEHVPGRFFPQGGKWKNCKTSKEENLMLQLLCRKEV